MPTLSLSFRSLLIVVLLTVSQSLFGEQTISDSALAVKKAARNREWQARECAAQAPAASSGSCEGGQR